MLLAAVNADRSLFKKKYYFCIKRSTDEGINYRSKWIYR